MLFLDPTPHPRPNFSLGTKTEERCKSNRKLKIDGAPASQKKPGLDSNSPYNRCRKRLVTERHAVQSAQDAIIYATTGATTVSIPHFMTVFGGVGGGAKLNACFQKVQPPVIAITYRNFSHVFLCWRKPPRPHFSLQSVETMAPVLPSFGSSQIKAATNRHGYSAMGWVDPKPWRVDFGGSMIAVEKKMPRHKRTRAQDPGDGGDDAGDGDGGTIEVRVMIYVEKHAVAVCVFDRRSDDHHHTCCSHHGDLFNDDPQWVYAAGKIDTIGELEKVLKAPLEYGLSKKLVYSRNGGDIAEKWTSAQRQKRCPDACSSCGKQGLHISTHSLEFHMLKGGNVDDSGPILRACSRCHQEYYCSRSCQKAHWRKHKMKCKDKGCFDGAVRWGVAAITGGLTTNQAEVDAIRDVCNQFDYLLFDDDAPPSFSFGRISCGGPCALTALILRIGKRFHQVKGFADVKEAMAVLRGAAHIVEDCYLGFPPCQNIPTFRRMYKKELAKLEQSILALRPSVRAELIHWFFERLQCDRNLTMITSDYTPLTREKMFPVHFALTDYARLVHGKFDDRAYCGVHGTIDLDREEEEDDEEDDEDEDEDEEEDGMFDFASMAKEALLARNNPSYEQDIRCVMCQVDYCSRATAVDALLECNGDIVEAALKIIEERKKNESNNESDLEEYENVD